MPRKIVITIPDHDQVITEVGPEINIDLSPHKNTKFFRGGKLTIGISFFKFIKHFCKEMGWKVRMYK